MFVLERRSDFLLDFWMLCGAGTKYLRDASDKSYREDKKMNKIKMNRTTGLLGIGAVALSLALAGCGGSSNSGDSTTTIHGRLESGDQTLPNSAYVEGGSYVDVYSCVARRDGSAQVDLKSSDFDSFLIVGTEDSNHKIQTITTDDNSGDGRNAKAKFDVNQDVVYFVAATNADGAGRGGSYELDFSDNLKDVVEEKNVTPQILAAAVRALHDSQMRKAQSVKPAATP